MFTLSLYKPSFEFRNESKHPAEHAQSSAFPVESNKGSRTFFTQITKAFIKKELQPRPAGLG